MYFIFGKFLSGNCVISVTKWAAKYRITDKILYVNDYDKQGELIKSINGSSKPVFRLPN